MDEEQKYDISDRYGAIMLFKAIKQSCEDSMNNPTQKFMQNTYKLAYEKLEKVIADIEADIYRDFTGTLTNLAERLKGNEDDS